MVLLKGEGKKMASSGTEDILLKEKGKKLASSGTEGVLLRRKGSHCIGCCQVRSHGGATEQLHPQSRKRTAIAPSPN